MRVRDRDVLSAGGAVATGIGRRPGAMDDVIAGAITRCGRLVEGDGRPTAIIVRRRAGRGGDVVATGGGVGRTAAQNWGGGVRHRDVLRAGGAVAASIGGRPGAMDDVIAGAITRCGRLAEADGREGA